MADPVVFNPPTAQFNTNGGLSQHEIINPSPQRIAIKVSITH